MCEFLPGHFGYDAENDRYSYQDQHGLLRLQPMGELHVHVSNRFPVVTFFCPTGWVRVF